MGIGELIFILIFILFGLFNLVVRVLVSRARRRKQVAESSRIKPRTTREQTERKAGVEERISEVRQFLEAGPLEATPLESGSLEAEPQNAQIEGGPSRARIIETYTGEGEAVQEQYVSRVLKEFESPRGREYQTAENMQEVTSIEMEKQALPSLDVSISDQQLSGIGFEDFGGMDFQERVHRGGWERIQKLPPLKKAIVLSELLGKPKAMEE
jgi:hypothetical protein